MDITVVQFVRPDGHRRESTIHGMPEDLAPIIHKMKACGCRLTAEVIFNNVAFTIDCPKEEFDFDMELYPNGPTPDGTPGPRHGLEKLIRRFDSKKFREMSRAVAES